MNKNIGYLVIVFLIYSFAVLSGKFASQYEPLSLNFILFYGLQLVILMVYAVLWQIALKLNKLNVAYTIKAVTILFGVFFGVIFFQESISFQQMIAIAIIFCGIVMVVKYE